MLTVRGWRDQSWFHRCEVPLAQSFVPDYIMPGAQRLKAGGEGDNRGQDEIDWMVSPTWWTWVWASFGRWWRTEMPGMLQSMGSLRVGHDWATSLSLFTFMRWRRKWQPTPVFLPGESQGRGSLVGCRPLGRTESDTTEVTWQQQQHAIDNQTETMQFIFYWNRQITKQNK